MNRLSACTTHQPSLLFAFRYAIPMDYHSYPGVEAIFLTCWKFVNWLVQLSSGNMVFVALHIDGKHKLHHGRWIFVALGIHCLGFRSDSKKYTQSFRPLLFMMCKQIETIESIKMMLDVRRSMIDSQDLIDFPISNLPLTWWSVCTSAGTEEIVLTFQHILRCMRIQSKRLRSQRRLYERSS